MNDEHKAAICHQIEQANQQRYMGSYLAALGANIHVGEKRARKLARDAGCLALTCAVPDFEKDIKKFSEACSKMFIELMEAHAESESSIITPETPANGNIVTLQ